MKLFKPELVYFEPASLDYPLGMKLYNEFNQSDTQVLTGPVQNISRHIPGANEKEKYARAKRTLAVAVKKSLKFDICKPSADFEFSLVTNCPGNCEYCYLQTTQAYKPYLRTYVNLEEIFDSIKSHAEKSGKNPTIFEVASAGDPLSLEHITGSLGKTIEFFGSLTNAGLRVVTKFSNVDPVLNIRHNGKTRFRFSINSRYVIKSFEHNTASMEERIEAAAKIAAAGYPLGFIVAPIMIYPGWKEEYLELFRQLKKRINSTELPTPATFELIQYRFTPIAKKFILERFPDTRLDMDESTRSLKWGKYGRFKYVYPKETSEELNNYISSVIKENFPSGIIEYFT